MENQFLAGSRSDNYHQNMLVSLQELTMEQSSLGMIFLHKFDAMREPYE